MAINNGLRFVFVTGGTGLLGRVIIPLLLDKGYNVVGITRKSGITKDKFVSKHKRLKWFTGNFEEALEAGFKYTNKYTSENILIHLAGKADVIWCSKNLSDAYNANVELTIKVLNWCAKANVKRFLFPSSALVYGAHGNTDFYEKDTPHPTLWYATTKLASEELIKGWAVATGLKADILRLPNVYGSMSSSMTVIGKLIDQAKNKIPFRVYDLSPVRDFIYDKDVAMGFLKTIQAESVEKYRIMNLSTGISTQIFDLIKIANKIRGKSKYNCEVEKPIKVSSKLVLNNTLLKNETGWMPKTTLEDGLRSVLV
jgi:UDP-glucose 4-epimerase